MNTKMIPIALATLTIVCAMPQQLASMAFAAEPTSAPAAPDPALIAAGAKSFRANCAECHSISKDEAATVGPNLWGLMGKKAGHNPDFPYSDAMKNSPVIWTTETLDKWVTSPPALIPDNAMPFVGLKDMAERKALVAYIAKISSEE